MRRWSKNLPEVAGPGDPLRPGILVFYRMIRHAGNVLLDLDQFDALHTCGPRNLATIHR